MPNKIIEQSLYKLSLQIFNMNRSESVICVDIEHGVPDHVHGSFTFKLLGPFGV